MFDTIFASVPVLETARCVLRPISADDTADMFRLMSDPQVTRFLGHIRLSQMDEAAQRVDLLLGRTRDQTGMAWMIVHEGEVVGNALLFNLVKAHFRAEIGYALLPAWWGKGLIAEVMSPVVDYAFTAMGLHSIEAKIDPENTGSRRVLEKLGFVQEGYFRESFYDRTNARFFDTAVFSRIKPE